MSTEPKLWPLRKLRSARSGPGEDVEIDPEDPIAFAIPEFQRSLVWPEGKQRSLVESILLGYPIGALLLVEQPDRRTYNLDGQEVQATVYGIVDGLQRTNAIVTHLREGLVLSGAKAIPEGALTKVSAHLGTLTGEPIDEDRLSDLLVRWLLGVKRPEATAGFRATKLLQFLKTEFPPLAEASADVWDDLEEDFTVLLEAIRKRTDISDHLVPVLIYRGPKRNLPEIFERINTKGTILSKYEVFAASWFDERVRVAGPRAPQIQKLAKARYAKLENAGFVVERPSDTTTLGVFDYFFALSQLLGKEYPRLFSKKAAGEGKLSSAFPLGTLLLGLSLDNMGDLASSLPLQADGTRDPGPLTDAMLEAAAFVDDALAAFLGLTLQSDTEALAHSELQMVSIVAAVAANLYDFAEGFARRKPSLSPSKRKRLELAIPQHYIYDIVRQEWRGSLYTYAYERTWDTTTEGGDLVPSDFYATPVPRASFEAALASSRDRQMADVSHRRKNITAQDRAFLKFLYAAMVTAGEQAKFRFDVDHIVPVKRIQSMTKGGAAWPIGAIGNLAVIPSGENRRRREESIPEYLGRVNSPPSESTSRMLERLLFCEPDEAAIPKDDEGRDAMTSDEFSAFVRTNWNRMCARLIERLDLK